MKPFIVLIPGMMCNSDVYAHQINSLEKFFNVIVKEFNEYRDIALGVKNLASNLPNEFHLLGHSMGGIVAMEIVRQHSRRVLSLALLNTNPYKEKQELKERRNQRLNSTVPFAIYSSRMRRWRLGRGRRRRKRRRRQQRRQRRLKQN